MIGFLVLLGLIVLTVGVMILTPVIGLWYAIVGWIGLCAAILIAVERICR